MDIHPNDLPHKQVYKLLTATVVPRPIAWVSTIDAEGNLNLAPFSFFNAVCSAPPTVLFCPSVRDNVPQQYVQKDTYHNVQATGEFVINFVSEDLVEAMNISATEVPSDVNEFERAGVTPIASKIVRVPGVAESKVRYECALNQIVTISDQPGGGHIIIGTVVQMYFADEIYREGNYIDIAAYKPVGRLTGPGYTRTASDMFDLARLPSELK